jgi:UDP-glucose 4-epimerase
MRVLVVGGAGYIGSHAVRRLLAAGHDVRVYDSLISGHAAAVPSALLARADLSDRAKLEATLRDHGTEAVMHFAASISVPESVANPAEYYRNNVVGSLNLLEAMRAVGVRKIVFSSTAAVYGAAKEVPIEETTPTNPINPYGFTKRVVEQALADYAAAYGLGSVALRYFNACGAADDGSIGEDHRPETHLIPIILEVALGRRANVSVFGEDYPTPDGTCIRDFIHVQDLAEAHLLVLQGLRLGEARVYNVATGAGMSVRDVIESARRVTGHAIPVVSHPRRAGDPPVLVASAQALMRDFGWSPRFTKIDDIVRTAWNWLSLHPDGYGEAVRP